MDAPQAFCLSGADTQWVADDVLTEHTRRGCTPQAFCLSGADTQWVAVDALTDYFAKMVDDNTCVIVASCPGSKMEAAEGAIVAIKQANPRAGAQVHLAYSQKEGANAWLGRPTK